ncbi:enoyl-CoA hydratase-related protein, partial [Cribrihabitans sp. XS_ASV171]
MAEFTLTKDAEGVATITWDVPGKTMNVMSFTGLEELESCIDDALADDTVKGIVITSGKDGSFAGGMDLNLLAVMKEQAGD